MEKRAGNRSFLKFISYLQIIGIVFVVLGHSFSFIPMVPMVTRCFYIEWCLISECLCFFSFRAFWWYTLHSEEEKHGILRNSPSPRWKDFLIPYFVLSVITFIPRASMSAMAEDTIELSLSSFSASLVREDSLVIPYFWFLQASFILLVTNYLGMYFCSNSRKATATYILCAIAMFAILPLTEINWTCYFSIDSVVRLGVFFVLGMAYSFWFDKICVVVDLAKIKYFIILIILWATVFLITEGTYLSNIASVFGILMCISSAMLLEKHNIRILDHLIGANYMIFLLSWYFNVASQQVLSHFVTLPWWIHSILSLISGIYIPLLAYRYLQSHPDSRWIRITAFLLGQQFRKAR